MLCRSASGGHRLRRAQSYHTTQCGPCGVRSDGRTSPEIIAEEDERSCKSGAAVEADVEQIKATVLSLQTELTKLRESTLSVGDAHSRLLAEIYSKLDGAAVPRQRNLQGGHGSSPAPVKKAAREADSGSSSKKQSYHEQGELPLMNHFIEMDFCCC
ncbi:unnamed protein product [Urochloa humidicola]